jgi:hypothetical protein
VATQDLAEPIQLQKTCPRGLTRRLINKPCGPVGSNDAGLSYAGTSAREDHCTVPRARPPEVRQEHPVPTGAGLAKAQVRTDVAQYPPAADATGVW